MKIVNQICKRDERYHPRSYLFVLEALDFTAKKLNKPAAQGPERHVSGGELLEGIRSYALEQFGPMVLTVFENWGIRETADFGEIVFNLVESGKLRKTDEDTRADFAGGYDFQEAFAKPFLPDSKAPVTLPPERRTRKPRRKREREGDNDE